MEGIARDTRYFFKDFEPRKLQKYIKLGIDTRIPLHNEHIPTTCLEISLSSKSVNVCWIFTVEKISHHKYELFEYISQFLA